MIETIQEALAPLLLIGSFCGLSFFEYPLGRPRPYFTCLYFLVKWSFFAYIFHYLVYTSSTTFLYMSWPSIIIILATTVSTLVSLFYFKELKICLYKLSIVDDTMEVFGTPKDYQRLYNWTIQTIIGWIVLAFVINIWDSVWLNKKCFSITRIFVPFFGNYLLHVNTFNSLMWGIILRYVSCKFQQVNEHIYNLLQNNAKYTRLNKLIIVGQQRMECRQYMWIIMHVHQQLCRISRELNKICSIQMTLQMTSYFAFFVELFLEFYKSFTDIKETAFEHHIDNLLIYSWAIIYSAKLLTLNYICQIICDKANGTVEILYKLSNDSFDENLRKQILQFILQIKQRELKLSGVGLFYFGYNFIRQFYASVLTVLILLTQMT